jgi:Chalcone isomerase-like
MKSSRRELLLCAMLLAATCAHAQGPALPAELAVELPGARLQGQGRLRFLGLRIYDAKLWVGKEAVTENWAGVPFALELDYARDFQGKQIAERSLAEMKRQGDVPADTATRWLATMEKLFPDVKKGDRLSAVNVPGTGARFFMNGTPRGDISDAEFVRQFFGIWLSPRSSEPSLREALLGRGSPG